MAGHCNKPGWHELVFTQQREKQFCKVPRLSKAQGWGADLLCGPRSSLPPGSWLPLPGPSWRQNHLPCAPGVMALGPQLPPSTRRKRREALPPPPAGAQGAQLWAPISQASPKQPPALLQLTERHVPTRKSSQFPWWCLWSFPSRYRADASPAIIIWQPTKCIGNA